jgi:hypothetical protein
MGYIEPIPLDEEDSGIGLGGESGCVLIHTSFRLLQLHFLIFFHISRVRSLLHPLYWNFLLAYHPVTPSYIHQIES